MLMDKGERGEKEEKEEREEKKKRESRFCVCFPYNKIYLHT